MKTVYYWKVLSEDGLLKDHKPLGNYWDTNNELSYGFNTKEDAIEKLKYLSELYHYEIARELVLIETIETYEVN